MVFKKKLNRVKVCPFYLHFGIMKVKKKILLHLRTEGIYKGHKGKKISIQ